jgi:hypothetical protein
MATVTINQVAWDFANLQISIDVLEKSGSTVVPLTQLPIAQYIKEINYTPKLEIEDMHGSSRNVQDTTDGMVSHEASMTVEAYGALYLVETIHSFPLRGLGTVLLTIGVQFYKAGLPLHVHTIHQSRIVSPEFAFKMGAEALSVPISLKPKNVFLNGTDYFGNPIA